MSKYKTFLEGKLDDLLKPLGKDEVPSTWILNKDGTYDVDGDVDYGNGGLDELPHKFGKVSGDFYCNVNRLTTLDGAPKEVGGVFHCGNNKLTSLIGAPNIIGRNFNCGYNRLTSLDGAPKIVEGNFYCSKNMITSLNGCPEEVNGRFEIDNNAKKFISKEIRAVCKVKGEIFV